MNIPTTATQSRGKQAKPDAAALRNYWRELRAAAEAGDLSAKALLIALAEGRPLIAAHSAPLVRA